MYRTTISNSRFLLVTGLLIISAFVYAALFAKNREKNLPGRSAGRPGAGSTKAVSPVSENNTVSVVELFTSEGCSSCPPADQLVTEAQTAFKDNIIVLSYHVDYWDRLGWKDPFSKNIFTERQKTYTQHFNLESIYTPQAVVNGKTEFVGSDKTSLWNAIQAEQQVKGNDIRVGTIESENNKLIVPYSYPELRKNESVVLELVLTHASSRVKGGENSGFTLQHINIVQDIIENKTATGTCIFNLPAGFVKEDHFVVAFIQDNKTLQISHPRKVKFHA